MIIVMVGIISKFSTSSVVLYSNPMFFAIKFSNVISSRFQWLHSPCWNQIFSQDKWKRILFLHEELVHSWSWDLASIVGKFHLIFSFRTRDIYPIWSPWMLSCTKLCTGLWVFEHFWHLWKLLSYHRHIAKMMLWKDSCLDPKYSQNEHILVGLSFWQEYWNMY